MSLEGMRSAVGDRLKPALGALKEGAVPHQDAHSAEWAAPAVIDDLLGARSRAWLEAPHGMRALASEDAFQDHVAELADAVEKAEKAPETKVIKTEDKIRVLRDAGYDMDLGGKDITSVQYQNANNSVRVSDEFMQAVVDDAAA